MHYPENPNEPVRFFHFGSCSYVSTFSAAEETPCAVVLSEVVSGPCLVNGQFCVVPNCFFRVKEQLSLNFFSFVSAENLLRQRFFCLFCLML